MKFPVLILWERAVHATLGKQNCNIDQQDRFAKQKLSMG